MNPSRIHAIETIHLEAPPGAEEDLRWFYGEVGGLDPVAVADEGGDSSRMCFKSGRVELWIELTEQPQIESRGRRLTLKVPSLEDAATMLEERSVRYLRFTGVLFTDRRLATLDPAGNRVELKQEWPYAQL